MKSKSYIINPKKNHKTFNGKRVLSMMLANFYQDYNFKVTINFIIDGEVESVVILSDSVIKDIDNYVAARISRKWPGMVSNIVDVDSGKSTAILDAEPLIKGKKREVVGSDTFILDGREWSKSELDSELVRTLLSKIGMDIDPCPHNFYVNPTKNNKINELLSINKVTTEEVDGTIMIDSLNHIVQDPERYLKINDGVIYIPIGNHIRKGRTRRYLLAELYQDTIHKEWLLKHGDDNLVNDGYHRKIDISWLA